MCCSKASQYEDLKIIWNDEELEQVEQYSYLRVSISQNRKIEEVNNRIAKANNVYYRLNQTVIGKREVKRTTKLLIYNSVYTPTLTYGAESWVINKRIESRITGAEMRFLRKTTGNTRRDRIRNQNIREELKVEPLIETIEKTTLRWYGHVVRMKEERLPRKMLEVRSLGTRGKGRPRIEWEEYVEGLCTARGKTKKDIKRLALERKEFRKWTQETRRREA